MPEQRKQTLVFVRRDNEVLLGLKKRGFAAGTWNGYGGKCTNNETISQCAGRELEEECRLRIPEDEFENVGILKVGYISKDSKDSRDVYLFLVNCNGLSDIKPMETEEMRPQWFRIDELPFKKMLPDAKLWIPELLKGRKLNVCLLLNNDGVMIDCIVNDLT